MNLIEVEHVSHRFADGTLALNDVSFSVTRGEFLIIAGRNGSGKTVLMKHLNGLLKPSSGSVRIQGFDTVKYKREPKLAVGLVFQNPDSQFVGQTVLEEIRFGPENLNLPENEIEKRTSYALEVTGLRFKSNHRPHTLSGGQKRRLAVAGILAMEPDVFVLDEPFSGLDLEGTRDILKAILHLYDLGHTLIVITHEVEKVLAHAGRMIVMENGGIVLDDHPSGLLEKAPAYGIHIPKGITLPEMTWME